MWFNKSLKTAEELAQITGDKQEAVILRTMQNVIDRAESAAKRGFGKTSYTLPDFLDSEVETAVQTRLTSMGYATEIKFAKYSSDRYLYISWEGSHKNA